MSRATRRPAVRAAVLVIVLVAVAGVGLIATGRAPVLSRAWKAATAPSIWAPSDPLSTADVPGGDAAASSADGGHPVPRRQTAPLSSAQLGAPLIHGTFVSACGAPDDMKVVGKVTVKQGHATEVHVETQPPNPGVASCVEGAIRDLQWDVTPKVGHLTVRY